MHLIKLISQFQSYSFNMKSILVWNMIFCFGLGIHLVLYNLFLQEILHDEVLVGKILGGNFLAQAIIYIPAGLFSDRFGSRKGVIAGVTLFVGSLLGNIFASTPGELSFWGFMVGLGHAASIVSFVPLLTDYSHSSERSTLFTFAFSTGTFSTFFGTLLGGIMSDSISTSFNISQIGSLRITLAITILLLIICTIPLFFVKEAENRTRSKEKSSSLLAVIKNDPRTLTPLFRFSIAKALAGISIGSIAPLMNLFFLHKFALSASYISFILATGTLTTVLFMSFNSKITKKLSDVKAVSLYHILSIPTIVLLGLTSNIWIAAIAYILFRSTKYGLNPIESKMMMEIVNPEVRGLTNSFGFMTHSLTISMIGPFSMYLVQVAGYQYGYLILCIISAFGSLFSAFYFLITFRKSERISPYKKIVTL